MINKKYNIGEMTITKIEEKFLTPFPTETLFPDLNMYEFDKNKEISLFYSDISEDKIILSVHTWLVEFDNKIILIDTGIGNEKERKFSALFHNQNTPFLQKLESTGISPDDVNYVLMTHLHADHIGWNTQLIDGCWVPTFPNAKYVFPKAEMDFYSTPESENRRVIFEDSIIPIIENKMSVQIPAQGGEFLKGVIFHSTPGHSVGHMSISIMSEGEEAFFTGDTMHHPIQVALPRLNSVFCRDSEQSIVSRRWMLDYALKQAATVFTSHFGNTSVGIITKKDDAFEWKFI